jgi:hypothetical protein
VEEEVEVTPAPDLPWAGGVSGRDEPSLKIDTQTVSDPVNECAVGGHAAGVVDLAVGCVLRRGDLLFAWAADVCHGFPS